MNQKKSIVISLGGSLIVPKEGIDTGFLRKFRKFAAAADCRFILVCGGGATARNYQKAAAEISKISRDGLDWLGIEATILNAKLVQVIFGKLAHAEIVKNPTQKIDFKEKILIAAGWKPGWSTDYDAVLLAKTYGAKTVINLTNIDYLYDKNPNEFENVKKIKAIDWDGFRKIVGDEFTPGANTPFDPVASREAQKSGLELILANGKNINNLKKIIKGGKFKGSVVRGGYSGRSKRKV